MIGKISARSFLISGTFLSNLTHSGFLVPKFPHDFLPVVRLVESDAELLVCANDDSYIFVSIICKHINDYLSVLIACLFDFISSATKTAMPVFFQFVFALYIITILPYLSMAFVCGNDERCILLGIQPRPSNMPGKHSTTELDLQPLGVTLFFFKICLFMYISALFARVPS